MDHPTKSQKFPPLPKTCAFCGSPDLTREHVYAKWMLPYIGKSGGHTVSITAVDLTSRASRHAARPGRLNRGMRVLRIVCGPCNSGWMSLLQAQAKRIVAPFLKGQWPEIAVNDQRTLAAWITMTAMVSEFKDLATMASTREQREYLRSRLEPPPQWSIWLGHHRGRLWHSGTNHFGWNSIPLAAFVSDLEKAIPIALARTKDSQSTALVFDSLFVQTLSSTNPGIKIREAAVAERYGLRVLWPLTGAPILRPTKVLSDLEADAISAAFVPLPRNRIRRAWEH